MKIIEQSHQFIHETDLMKLIELAGRTCYKSEDKITGDSAKRFVQMITKAGHYSVLEHAIICFEIGFGCMQEIQRAPNGKYFNFLDSDRVTVSGNFRAWLELIQEQNEDAILVEMHNIWNYLHLAYPVVFPKPRDNSLGTAKIIREKFMDHKEKLIHATRTCRFITNRGVTHEMVRHRPWAYSQESTRYVKYDGNMEFIIPVWFDDIWLGDWSDRESAWQSRFERRDEDWMQTPALWLWSCEEAEAHYKILITEYAWQPQQARDVLPNSLKTEIVCTATLSEWKHMLNLRTSKAAHPQIRALMKPVLAELQEELPEIFKEDTNGTN